MKKRSLILLSGIAALLTACLPSVAPYYTTGDLMLEPRLLGEWQAKDKTDEPEMWKFEDIGTNFYKLTITEKECKKGRFEAHVFQLEGGLFLDLLPTECNYAPNQADLVAFSMFPGHLLVRVSQVEPELKLAMFNFDWLANYLKANPKALAHHTEGDRIILTAETQALQRFVLAHLGEGQLFDKGGSMVRRSKGIPAAQP